jgi:L-lactate dehydrogenase complex protein LldF
MSAPIPATQFHRDADVTTGDVPRRAFIRKALHGYEVKRDETKATFTSWSAARDAASAVKYEGVNHLDRYLEEFEAKFTARGGRVFWASTGAQARDYILELARVPRGEVHRQIEGDDERGDPPESGADRRRLRGGGERPR